MRKPPTPAVSHSSSLLHVRVTPPRFQCDAAGVGVSFVHFPHGFPLALARVSPAVTHGAPPPEALLCADVDAEEVQ